MKKTQVKKRAICLIIAVLLNLNQGDLIYAFDLEASGCAEENQSDGGEKEDEYSIQMEEQPDDMCQLLEDADLKGEEVNDLDDDLFYEFNEIEEEYLQNFENIVPELSVENITYQGATVLWKPVEYAQGYCIYRKMEGGDYNEIATVPAGVEEYVYVDTTAIPGSVYHYTVRGFLENKGTQYWTNCNEDGLKIETKELSIPNLVCTIPLSNTSLELHWEAVEGAKEYRIYRKETGKGWKGIRNVKGSQNSYIDTVKKGQNYYYTVRAFYDSYMSECDLNGISGHTLSTVGNLKATVEADGTVQIGWKKIEGAQGYRIYRKTAGGSWKGIGNADAYTADYLDTTAIAGTTYYYTVRAFVDDYYSDFKTSGVKAAITLGTPGLKKVTVHTNGNVTISWNKAVRAQGYRIYRKTAGGSWKGLENVNAATTNYVDDSVPAGKTYYYTVRAYAGNNYSEYNKNGLKAAITLGMPGLKKATVHANGNVTISWNKAVRAQGYRIYRKTAGGSWKGLGNVSSTTTSYVDMTAPAGKTYYYTVRAYSRGNYSNYNKTGLKAAITLGTPVLKNATVAESGDVTVSWGKAARAQGYRIYRKTAGGSWKGLGNVSSTTTSYVDMTALAGKTYYYTVRAFAGNIYSQYNAIGVKVSVPEKIDIPAQGPEEKPAITPTPIPEEKPDPTPEITPIPIPSKDGWKVIDGKKYYYENGKLIKGFWEMENGDTYYFDPKDGTMRTGFIDNEEELFLLFFGEDGRGISEGFHDIEGRIYYCYYPGYLVRNSIKEIAGDFYSFDENGWMLMEGWKYDCYYGSDGKRQYGLTRIGKDLFYFDPENEGTVVRDEAVEVDGKGYYFTPDGKCGLSEKAQYILKKMIAGKDRGSWFTEETWERYLKNCQRAEEILSGDWEGTYDELWLFMNDPSGHDHYWKDSNWYEFLEFPEGMVYFDEMSKILVEYINQFRISEGKEAVIWNIWAEYDCLLDGGMDLEIYQGKTGYHRFAGCSAYGPGEILVEDIMDATEEEYEALLKDITIRALEQWKESAGHYWNLLDSNARYGAAVIIGCCYEKERNKIEMRIYYQHTNWDRDVESKTVEEYLENQVEYYMNIHSKTDFVSEADYENWKLYYSVPITMEQLRPYLDSRRFNIVGCNGGKSI